MIDIGSLDDFCAEMQRLADVVEIHEFLPSCGGPNRGGSHIALLEGGVYQLSYSEKGDTEVIAESPDPAVVMEQIFVEVTRNGAFPADGDQQPVDPLDISEFTSLTTAELRERAISLHLRSSAIQEELLGRLNPDWRQRQAARNADRVLEIESFFSR